MATTGAQAFEAQDADTIFASYKSAFYSNTGRSTYFKENTGGGHAWFWGQANMMEMVADVYDRTGSSSERVTLSSLCAGFMDYHGQDWSWNEYNDDIMWACIVFSKAYRMSGNTTFRDVAKANFDRVWTRGWSNDLGGGMWWRTDNQTKNACDNCPAAIVACMLYEITGDESYLTKAKMLMAWTKANLVTTNGAVYDHMNREGQVTTWIFSYNQGTYVGASNYLYKLTGDQTYFQDALLATRYMRDHACDSSGIFPDYGGGDGSGFNGVGVRWLAAFIKDQNLWAEFYPWLKKNADAAWNVRRADNLSWNNWKSPTAAGTRYAFECFGSVTALQVVPASNPASTAAALNVPEVTDDGYQIVYDLDIPLNGGFQGATTVPYSVNNSATTSDFDRIAYYFELTQTNGTKQWAYASMDAFTDDARKIGLPHNVNNAVVFQQPVKSLNVLSNVDGVVTGDFMEGGNVEMWPSNYDPGNSAGIHAANGGAFDWGDGGANTGAGFGSFQVHNAYARQTVFAYNHWGESSGPNDDVGIGNRPTADTDWTFSANAGSYTARRLTILVRPRVPRVTLARFPQNRAVCPRDPSTGKAAVPVSGTVDAAGYTKAVLRILRNGEIFSTLEQPLVYASGAGAPFSFAPEIQAEAVNYTFELAIVSDSGEKLVRRAVEVVGGDVLLFYGQSNMEAGRGFSANNQSSAVYSSPFVRTFGQNADSGTATRNNLFWVPANGDGAGSNVVDPGAVGQWAIVVGRKILDDYGIPVALLNGARGGYSMAQLQKDDANPDLLDDGTSTRTYNRLRFRALRAGVAANARAMFYYQGEAQNDDAASYAAGWEGLWNDWKTDYPALEHFYQVQVRPGCGVTVGDVGLRQLQRTIGDVYPDITVMTGNGLTTHDGCHYQFTNGYEKLGLFHYRQVARDLYGAPNASNIDALNPSRVEFTDGSRRFIRVEMRDPGATINFPVEALVDFAVTGAPGAIVGRTISGNSFTLELDQPATGAAVLEYRGHLGQGSWVTNGSGVGMLAFSEPVGPFGPAVTLTSPVTTSEADVNTPIPVRATAAPGPNGDAVRMVLYANGLPQFEVSGGVLDTTWTPPTKGAYRLSVSAFDANGTAGSAAVAVLAGAEAMPGGVGMGLKAWFRAESGVVRDGTGAVSQWLDQSGNGNNASQGSAFSKPHFSEGVFGAGPGVVFDGGDFLTAVSGMPTGDYTKVVRFKATSAAFSNNLISSNVSNNAAGDHAFWAPELKPSVYHSDQRITASRPIAPNAMTIMIATYDSAANLARLYVNGALNASGTMAKDNSISSFQLGAFANSNNLYGAISEVMIYDRVLGDADRTAIGAYLGSRHRTPFQLWQANTPGGGGMPGADEDGDGFPNVMEYAFGLDPAVKDSPSMRGPDFQIAGGEAVLTYHRLLDRPDVAVRLESSPDLINWSAAPDEVMGTADGRETRRFRDRIPGEGNGSRFYRMNVWQP